MTILRRNQSVATAGKSSFIYDFLILNDADLEVLLTPTGQSPDDDNDRLTIVTDYQVTGVGNNVGGTIELVTDANAGDIITIQGARPLQPPTDFSPGSVSADELNDAINGVTILIEDVQTQICAEMLSYQRSNVFNVNLEQNKIPILNENEAWVGGINNAIVKVILPDSVDAGILRAQLADDQPGTDGSRIVGYSNTVFAPNDTTVHDAMARLDTKVNTLEQPGQALDLEGNVLLGGYFGINPFQSGTNTLAVANDLTYVADGWAIQQAGTLITRGSRVSFVPTIATDNADILYLNSLEIKIETSQPVLGASDILQFTQFVEGNIFSRIAQVDELRLEFFVLSVLPGIYTVALRNSGSDRFIVKEYTIAASNTWQFVTLDFEKSPEDGTWDYERDIGLRFEFTLAAGTDFNTATTDTWLTGNSRSTANQVNFAGQPVNSLMNFAGIRLGRKGTVPLPRRTSQQELAFSQRYFEKTYDTFVDPGTVTPNGECLGYTPNFTVIPIFSLARSFLVQKRGLPIITWFSPFDGEKNAIRQEGPSDNNQPVTDTVGEGETSTGAPLTEAPGSSGSAFMRGHFTADARLI